MTLAETTYFLAASCLARALWPGAAWAGLAPAPDQGSGWLACLGVLWALAPLLMRLADGQAKQKDVEPLPPGLVASRDKLKAVFDAVEDPIISLTSDLSVESINLPAASWADRHPRELVGAPGPQVLSAMGLAPRVLEEVLATVALALKQGEVVRRLLHWPQGEGSTLYKLSVSPVLSGKGDASLVIVHFRDLTEDKSGLMREAKRLEDTVADLRTIDRERRDQTNMVVHDLKGPVSEVMGNLELIGLEPVSETQREYLDLAASGAEHLMQMIMNMLNVARLSEGRLKVRRGETDFLPLARRVRDRFKTLAALKGLVVEMEDASGRPVWADSELLERVVQNLFINSLNHTPEGGTIRLLATAGENGGHLLSVSDTGKGIPAGQIKRIFQKFGQAEDGPGHPGGTGLGLTFCKLAMEAHAGTIRVESQPGQGTTVHLEFPPAP